MSDDFSRLEEYINEQNLDFIDETEKQEYMGYAREIYSLGLRARRISSKELQEICAYTQGYFLAVFLEGIARNLENLIINISQCVDDVVQTRGKEYVLNNEGCYIQRSTPPKMEDPATEKGREYISFRVFSPIIIVDKIRKTLTFGATTLRYDILELKTNFSREEVSGSIDLIFDIVDITGRVVGYCTRMEKSNLISPSSHSKKVQTLFSSYLLGWDESYLESYTRDATLRRRQAASPWN
jgi:hypothetical protein